MVITILNALASVWSWILHGSSRPVSLLSSKHNILVIAIPILYRARHNIKNRFAQFIFEIDKYYFSRPWLDPVTAKKIMFVKKAQIKEHVDASVLLTICGGEDPWEFHQDMVTDEGGALLELHSNLLGQNKSTLDTITE